MVPGPPGDTQQLLTHCFFQQCPAKPLLEGPENRCLFCLAQPLALGLEGTASDRQGTGCFLFLSEGSDFWRELGGLLTVLGLLVMYLGFMGCPSVPFY